MPQRHPLAFDIHHIFSRGTLGAPVDATRPELGTIGEALGIVFSGASFGISLDMSGNKIGLFVDPSSVPNLSALINAGFGESPHGGPPPSAFHAAYNSFLAEKLIQILTSPGNPPIFNGVHP